MTNRLALFDDAPEGVEVISARLRLPRQRRKARRDNPQQTTIKLPPRLLPAEKEFLVDGDHKRLAYSYVARQGHRFENAIPRDEQVLTLLEELIRVLPRWNAGRGALSTFVSRCFFNRLAKDAVKAGRLKMRPFSTFKHEGAGFACEPVDIDDILDASAWIHSTVE